MQGLSQVRYKVGPTETRLLYIKLARGRA